MIIFLRQIKGKIFLFTISIVSLFLILGLIIVRDVERIVELTKQTHTDIVPLIISINKAEQLLTKGSVAISTMLIDIRRAEDYDLVRDYEAMFRHSMLQFDMFVNAIILGSESRKFEEISGGLTFTAWQKAGMPGKFVVKRAPENIQKLARQAEDYYHEFSDTALRIITSYKKSLRLELSGKNAEAKVELARARELRRKFLDTRQHIEEEFEEIDKKIGQYTVQFFKDMQARQQLYLRRIGFLSMFSVIFTWFLSIKLGDIFIVRPIYRLQKGVQRIGKGELDVEIKISSKDEFGQLAGAFNDMARKLRESYGSLEKKVKQRTHELYESQERIRLIIETANDAFISMDQDGFVTDWNKSAETIFGWPCSQVTGKLLTETIIPPQHREAHSKGLKHLIKTGEGPVLGKTLELSALRHDGQEFPIEIAIWATQTNGKYQFNAFVRDISKRKEGEIKLQEAHVELKQREESLRNAFSDLQKAHDEVKQTQEKLLQSEKLASIGHLAAGVAHEIKNPLSIISLSIEELAGTIGNLDKDKQSYIDMIRKAADRANKIVVGLLNFSRSSQQEVGTVFIHHIIDEALSLIQKGPKQKGIIFEHDYTPEEILVKGDKTLLEQVFFDLLDNSIDAIEKNGRIFVKTRIERATRTQRNIIIEISDNGVGMTEEIIKRTFEPFFTTKGPGKGTGLGLSIIYMILKKHYGTIHIESEPSVGTKFTVTLPIAEDNGNLSEKGIHEKQA